MRITHSVIKIRSLIQLVFLLLAVAFFIGIIYWGLPYTIHHICPYAIVCFGVSNRFVKTVFALTIAFSFLILVLSIFYGRIFCGWICPLGTIQELLFMLNYKKKKRRKQIPLYLERHFAKFKYIVLALTVILSLLGFNYLFIHSCPIFALSILPSIAISGLIVVLVILVGGIFWERFWCRFLCPYAALLNLFQMLSKMLHLPRLMMHRNLERCNDCGICSQNCPMNINLTQTEFVDNPNCILCFRCAQKCPKPDTIRWEKEQ
ncbi:MAG: 4Fe-4S binding protein [Candidatus Cloacimonas sp.]